MHMKQHKKKHRNKQFDQGLWVHKLDRSASKNKGHRWQCSKIVMNIVRDEHWIKHIYCLQCSEMSCANKLHGDCGVPHGLMQGDGGAATAGTTDALT